MSEFLEILSEGALEELKQVQAIVKTLASDIKSINNFKPSSTPSGADKGSLALAEAYKKREEQMDKARIALKKLSDAEAKAVAQKKAQMDAMFTAQEKANKKIEEQSRAYTELLARQKAATLALRDLVVETGKESAATKKLQKELNALNAELLQAEQASKKYAMGASSLATPVLLYAEAQKKATQATKEANAERAKANAMISKQMTGQMVESVNAIGKPTESLKRMNDYYRELEKTSAAEAKSAMANQNLNRAYVQLTNSREQAKQKLQDLIASERASTDEIKKAQKEFDVLNKKVAAADKAVGRFSDANRKINGLASSVGNLMSAFGVSTGIFLAVDVAKNIFNVTKELQGLDYAMRNVLGSQEKFVQTQLFLNDISTRFGVEIKSLTKNYTDFYAASKGIISDDKINDIFTSVSKSAAAMGLSVEHTDSAFLALEQMMSKGTVQAEELKKQLGNALPGAMRAAAMAYMELHPEIVSVQEAEAKLMNEMKKGPIDSATYIPLIVKNFEKLYGIESVEKIETLQGAVNNLSNAWTEMIRSFSQGGGVFSKMLIGFIDGVSWWIKNGGKALEYIIPLHKIIADIDRIINKNEYNKKEHDQNKYNARKQAISDLKQISEEEGKLTTKLFQKTSQLEKYQNMLKSATGEDVKRIKQLISLTESEIQSISGKIQQEKKLNEIKKESRLSSTISEAKSLFASSNSLELKNIEIKEKLLILNKKLSDPNNPAYGKKQGLLHTRKEIENLNKELEKNGKIITRNNVKATYYNEIIKTLQKKDDIPSVEVKKETEAQRKKREATRLKSEKDRLKAIEDAAKTRYDLKMAQLDQEKIILEQGLANEQLNYSERLNFAYLIAAKELEIAETKYKEEQRLSDGNNDKLKIADINYWKDKEKLAKEAIKRIQDVPFKPQYERQQLADAETYGEGVGVLGEGQTQAMVDLWQKGQDKIKETEEERIKRLKALRDVLNDVFQEFGQATGFESTMDMFAVIGKNGEDFWTNLTDKKKISEIEWNEWGLAITTVAQDAMNVIDQADEERHQRRLERLEKDKDIALKFAGDSAAAKEKIEAQYEKKRKALEVKEFKRKQKVAMANIAIDTAQAIMAVVAKSGNLWESIVVAALGAVQLGMVASQKPPEYWKGTDNAEAGLAYTQERGAEIILDKNNRVKSFGSDGGAQLTMMEKGDKVKTADQTKRIMFDAGLNSILSDNGIKEAKIEIVNKGLTVDEMDMVIGKHFANIQTNHTSFDQRGIQQWSEKNGNRTIRNSNRGSGIGFRV